MNRKSLCLSVCILSFSNSNNCTIKYLCYRSRFSTWMPPHEPTPHWSWLFPSFGIFFPILCPPPSPPLSLSLYSFFSLSLLLGPSPQLLPLPDTHIDTDAQAQTDNILHFNRNWIIGLKCKICSFCFEQMKHSQQLKFTYELDLRESSWSLLPVHFRLNFAETNFIDYEKRVNPIRLIVRF